jgi:hypothetical protein
MRMPPAKSTGIHSDRRSDSASSVRESAVTKAGVRADQCGGPSPQLPQACSSRPGIADASALTFPRPYATSVRLRTIAKKGRSRLALTFRPGREKPILAMTKLLKQALEAVQKLPSESQDEIARAMLALAGDESAQESIDPAHLPDVLEGLAQARRRQFVSDAEVEAAFRRFDQ